MRSSTPIGICRSEPSNWTNARTSSTRPLGYKKGIDALLHLPCGSSVCRSSGRSRSPSRYEKLERQARKWENSGKKLSVASAKCALEGGLNVGDKASISPQFAISVPSPAHAVFASRCGNSVRIAGLVLGSSRKVERSRYRARYQGLSVSSPFLPDAAHVTCDVKP